MSHDPCLDSWRYLKCQLMSKWVKIIWEEGNVYIFITQHLKSLMKSNLMKLLLYGNFDQMLWSFSIIPSICYGSFPFAQFDGTANCMRTVSKKNDFVTKYSCLPFSHLPCNAFKMWLPSVLYCKHPECVLWCNKTTFIYIYFLLPDQENGLERLDSWVFGWVIC